MNSIKSETSPDYEIKTLALSDLDTEDNIISSALNILESRLAPGQALISPSDVRNFLKLKLALRKNESFCTLFLDNRHQVILFEEQFHGTVNGGPVYPRVVAQRALELNAAAVIFAHNHPSGVTSPSTADDTITDKLVECLKLFEIRVLDHFIVGSTMYSYAEHGKI